MFYENHNAGLQCGSGGTAPACKCEVLSSNPNIAKQQQHDVIAEGLKVSL
jgi:hypothetical protein